MYNTHHPSRRGKGGRKENMKEYWLSDNKDIAEKYVLHMLVGVLEYRKEIGKPMTNEEILQYIEDSIQEEEDRMNKSFPNKAR